MEMWGRTMSGRGRSECKGPEVGEGLVGSVEREEASSAGARSAGRSLLVGGWDGVAGGDEDRGKPGTALIENEKGFTWVRSQQGSDWDSPLRERRRPLPLSGRGGWRVAWVLCSPKGRGVGWP